MRSAVFLIVVAFLLAGCSGRGSENPTPTPTNPMMESLAPGCAANRTAVAHHADMRNATTSLPVPFGCLVHTGVDSSEPTIGIASDGTVFHYPAALIDRDTPAADGVRFLTGIARTQNEGADWRVLLPTAGPTAPTHQASLDPYMYLDRDTDRIWADDLISPNCSVLSWSDDLGETWTNSLGGCIETDHQTLFTGPPVSSTTLGYPNILYRCSINAVALDGSSTASTCVKSLDGGMSNVPSGQPAFVTQTDDPSNICSGAVGHGITDDYGAIYLPKGHCGVPMLGISRDEGSTWTRVRVTSKMMEGDPQGGYEHDAGVGVDAEGNVYFFWISDDRMPYLTISRDGGATWDEPRMVGVPGLTEAHLPAASVRGVGKIAFAYFGSFDSPGAPWDSSKYQDTDWDLIIGMSVDALSDDPTFLSARANPEDDPVAHGVCSTVRCNDAVKDFIHLEIGPDGTPWVSIVDGCIHGCKDVEKIDGREGAAGRLWGGPSLLDDAAPSPS